MNWFEILKNTGLAQSQRQGFRLDDKDEDYVLEDEEDCRQKIIDEFTRVCQKLFKTSPEDIHTSDIEDIIGVVIFNDELDEYEDKARLTILYPKNDADEKALCLFYDKFSKGRSFFPTMPRLHNEEKLEVGPENYFVSRNIRETNEYHLLGHEEVIYEAALYDFKPDRENDGFLIELYFSPTKEVDW